MGDNTSTTELRKMPIIPAGSVLRISENGLCDYDVRGVFRAEKDIDAEALRAAWLQAHPEQARGCGFSEDQFIAWVVELGFLTEIESYEWFLCQSGQAETMDVFAPSAKRPPADSAEWLAGVAKAHGVPVVYAEIPLRTAFVGEDVSDYESYYTRTEPDPVVEEMRAAQEKAGECSNGE